MNRIAKKLLPLLAATGLAAITTQVATAQDTFT